MISSSSTTDSKIISTKIRPSNVLDSIVEGGEVCRSQRRPLILLDSSDTKHRIIILTACFLSVSRCLELILTENNRFTVSLPPFQFVDQIMDHRG